MRKRLIALSLLTLAALVSFGCGTGTAGGTGGSASAQLDAVIKTGAKAQVSQPAKVETKSSAAARESRPKAVPVSVVKPAAPRATQMDPREAARRYLAHEDVWQAEGSDVFYAMFDIDRDGVPELFVRYPWTEETDEQILRVFRLSDSGVPEEVVNPRKPDACPDIFWTQVAVYEEPSISGYEYVGYPLKSGEQRLTTIEASPYGLDWNVLGIHVYGGKDGSGEQWTDWKGNPITKEDFKNLESHAVFAKNKKRIVAVMWRHAGGTERNKPWNMLTDKEKEDFFVESVLYFEDWWNNPHPDDRFRSSGEGG